MDNTIIHPKCRNLAHLIDLFMFKGIPTNNDPDHEVQILINHGYIAGYCPDRLQPLWSAYRVAGADKDVDYDRPHLYYADERLDPDVRVAAKTFGKVNNIQYHVGHMVPNEVVNRQFGRLAQMETFFMSNMSPQRGTLNTGVWLDLEDAIRNIEDKPGKDHVWAVAGPIFGDDPAVIDRPGGQQIPIPEAYYYVTVDPFRYPWDNQSNVDVVCFKFPQDAAKGTPLRDYIADLSVIEAETKLNFFPGWEHEVSMADALESVMPEILEIPSPGHRILRHLGS